MWVSIESEAACSAALRQALDEYGIVNTAILHGVLEVAAADFARTLCTALQAAPPEASARPQAAEHAAVIAIMDKAIAESKAELQETEEAAAACAQRRAAQHHKMEAQLGEAKKRIEAVEVKQRAARAAAKAAEKAMKARHERDLAQLTTEREAIAEREAALSAREASARSLIADATKRFESAKELMESKRASSNRAAADASAAEAARAEAAADRKAAEAAITKCAQMQDAANRVAAAEAAAADSAATNVALREEVSAFNGGCCAALEAVAEAAETRCAELQAAVKVAEQRAVAAEQRAMQNAGKGGRGGRGPPWPSAPRSNFDQSARIAALESRLAAIRRAIAQGSHRHKIIMHGRQYTAYDYGEAPADGAERAEQEGLGYTLVDL